MKNYYIFFNDIRIYHLQKNAVGKSAARRVIFDNDAGYNQFIIKNPESNKSDVKPTL